MIESVPDQSNSPGRQRQTDPELLYVAEMDRISSKLHDLCAETEERLSHLLTQRADPPAN